MSAYTRPACLPAFMKLGLLRHETGWMELAFNKADFMDTLPSDIYVQASQSRNIQTVFPDLGTKLLRDRITNIHLTFTYTTIFGPHSHMPTHTTTTTPTRAAAGLQARSKRTDGRLLSLLLCRRKSKSGWTWNRRGPLLLLLLMHRNVKTHVGGRGKENA